MNFKGKTAVVTGASSGIGLGYAQELAARGANLVLVARNEPQLQKIAAEIMGDFDVRVDLTTAVLPEMLKQDFGVIVNIGSTASFQ